MKSRKQVCTFGTVTNDGAGIVGSFAPFNAMLKKAGFGCKRVLICYQEVSQEEHDELLEKYGEAWLEARTSTARRGVSKDG